STAMGFFQSIYSLGMFLGPVASGLLGDLWGLGAVFWSAAAVTAAGAALAWRWLRPAEGMTAGRPSLTSP
ncbi:MAG TPA: MFS transporter, partial [Limnochordia bacterium]